MKTDIVEHIAHSGKKPEWLAFISDAFALEVVTTFAHHQNKEISCLSPSELAAFPEWIHAGIVPNLIFIELSEMAAPYAELQLLKDSLPSSTQLIVLGAENDIGRYRQLQKMGINEYLFFPLSEALLMDACLKPVMKKVEPAQKNNLLIPIIGVRGGVGTTTVAINSAFTWSLLPQRVCLLDLDTQGGDIGLNLDMSERGDIQEALTEIERIDFTFINNLVIEKKPNFFVITNDWSVTNPYDGTQITEATLLHFLMLLYEKMESLFIDLSFPLNKNLTRMILPQASCCILVTDLSLSATRDTVYLLQWLKMNFPDLDIKIIANTSRPLLDTEQVQEALEKKIGKKLDLVLPYCKESMQQATLNGDVYMESFKRTPYAKKLHLFMQQIAQEHKVQRAAPKSFWQRLRGVR